MKQLKTLFLVLLSLALTGITKAARFGVGDHTLGMKMATLINPADLTWNGKEIMSIAETILIDIFNNPNIDEIMTVHEDIVAKEQIAYLGLISKITKTDAGCGTGENTSKNIPMTQKSWDPIALKSWLSMCYTDLDKSFWIWGQNKGYDRADLIGDKSKVTEFIMERMATAGLEDNLRMAWFCDTQIRDFGGEGSTGSPEWILTPGTDITDYNQLDGLWKKIYALDAVTPAQHITIANNAQGTYATQKFNTTDITARTVTNIFSAMVEAADTRLAEDPNQMLLVTRSLYLQYKAELRSYTNVEQSYIMSQEGKKLLAFDGVPIVEFSLWDRYIKADFDNKSSWYQPHRAMLTTKENLAIGVDAKAAINQFELFYLPKEQTVNFRGMYKMDTNIVKNYMFVSAY